MFRTTLKQKIFGLNVFTVLLLLFIIAVVFNISARIYMEREAIKQLRSIAFRTQEQTRHGFHLPRNGDRTSLIGPYIAITRSTRHPHFLFDAEVALVDSDMNLLIPYKEYTDESTVFEQGLVSHILVTAEKNGSTELSLHYQGTEYVAVVLLLEQELPMNISRIVFYTNLDKVSNLQKRINLILLAVVVFATIVVTFVSSYLSNKISTPLSKLGAHIRDLSERQFSSRIHIPADDEILELVNNINMMAEKLESYDAAQKSFLQNASHELRTPIMSIRSYAEGIQYGVVENKEAVQIILDETSRLTKLVENLLYLSRLDAIEETYHTELLDIQELLHFCSIRMKGIAKKQDKEIFVHLDPNSIKLFGDEEKLTRAFTNLLDNGIRYAKSRVVLSSCMPDPIHLHITVTDDGPGFTAEDLDNLFERFYKGKQGHFGLGLAITKSIIEKHKGMITAGNTEKGACVTVVLPIAHQQFQEDQQSSVL